MTQKEINNTLSLEPKERYRYLVKQTADFENIFLIVDENGHFVLIGSEEFQSIPVWPEEEIAALFLKDNWANYSVKATEIKEFIHWLEKLQDDKIRIAGFPDLSFKSVVVSPLEMTNHLLFELNLLE